MDRDLRLFTAHSSVKTENNATQGGDGSPGQLGALMHKAAQLEAKDVTPLPISTDDSYRGVFKRSSNFTRRPSELDDAEPS